MRALLSVSSKRGLAEFARGLHELGWELVASGGTALYLEEMALPVQRVEDLTEVPELLGGRVKTLHPRVHAGILARRDLPEDSSSLDEHAIAPFELVCVNLYPFSEAADRGAPEHELVELIDIGGPALLRAAAKNHAYVAAVSSPAQYATVLDEVRRDGELSPATRRRLAGEAFALTAAYESAIAAAFAGDEELPASLQLALRKERDLVYGENPHQRAALYAAPGAGALAGLEQLQGRDMSATNVLDLALARRLLSDLDGPACVIVKHANPCGAAVAATVEEAYEGALACDPVSAFGMVCAVNRPVSAELGGGIAGRFLDALAAPAYADAALEALRPRAATRVLRGDLRLPPDRVELRSVPGGLLAQERDARRVGRDELSLACGSVDEDAWRDLVFAWTICKHTTSNAIVLARDGRTIGIGAGQVSRVDAVRIALEKASAHGHETAGAVLASDGFFPFADGPQLALDAGIRALVQPGGSKRDGEVVEAVQRAGAAMVFTGVRHFRH